MKKFQVLSLARLVHIPIHVFVARKSATK